MILNNRPISLLPIISKVLERHVYNLLWDHLEEIGQMAENQWGFTHGKSTVTALLSTFNSVYQYMERGCDVALLFLDISKAFDSVPHVPLLQHLRDIGLNQFLLQWIAYKENNTLLLMESHQLIHQWYLASPRGLYSAHYYSCLT